MKVSPSPIERVPSKNVQGIMTYGPWGGNGGTLFDDGVYDGIKEIHLSRNVGIVSIRVCYDLNGHPQWGSKNGGTGGYKSDKVTQVTGFIVFFPRYILEAMINFLISADSLELSIRNLDSHNRLLWTCNGDGA